MTDFQSERQGRCETQSIRALDGGGSDPSATHFADHPIGEALHVPVSKAPPKKRRTPSPKGGFPAIKGAATNAHPPEAKPSSQEDAPGQWLDGTQHIHARRVTIPERGEIGHGADDTLQVPADLETTGSAGAGGQNKRDAHAHAASSEIPLIILEWRRHGQLVSAKQRLDLQAQAICRRSVEGDKAKAAKLWAQVKKGDGPDGLTLILGPFIDSIARFDQDLAVIERTLTLLVRKVPLWAWAKTVRGVAELSLARMIGDAGYAVHDYRTVSGLWKRFGLAVIQGQRQRLVANNAELAMEHGYNPRRRSSAYVLATNLMRSQRAGDPYRDLYDRRKAYELAREIPKAHAHNRAMRVMVKELLKDAWIADRAISRHT